MSILDGQTATIELFEANWDTNAIPVEFPNFALAEGDKAGTWVRMNILDADTRQIEIGSGNNQEKTVGIVMFNVFTQLGTGNGAALTTAKAISDIFKQNKRITMNDTGDIKFRPATVNTIGRRGSNNYYQVNVAVPFIRESVT